jgi:hypothetical protein
VSPVKYEPMFYIPEDILHSHRRENLKSYVSLIVSITISARKYISDVLPASADCLLTNIYCSFVTK